MSEERLELRQLREYLSTLPPGPIAEAERVETLLAACWDDFAGSGQSRTDASKLRGRTEEMMWSPPCLTFKIERHPGTVHGSVYAQLHKWTVNVDDRRAEVNEFAGRRVVGKKDKPLKVKSLAEEIAGLIKRGEPSPRLCWKSQSKVRLEIKKIIPTTNKETTASRRKRFREALQGVLSPIGWRMTTVNTFERTGSGDSADLHQ